MVSIRINRFDMSGVEPPKYTHLQSAKAVFADENTTGVIGFDGAVVRFSLGVGFRRVLNVTNNNIIL